ncbi:hypothetical protein LSAT2_006828 [Lamellibrachia satsuma]|nr:hypothetical protein LSAT2_006828 [Lamellibrachia satsuma]
MVNAYIPKCVANKPMLSNHREWSLLNFRMAEMHQMCDNFCPRNRAAMGWVHEVADVLERNVIQGLDLSANRCTPKKRCVETSYGCSLCRVSLCKSGPCFREHRGL